MWRTSSSTSSPRHTARRRALSTATTLWRRSRITYRRKKARAAIRAGTKKPARGRFIVCSAQKPTLRANYGKQRDFCQHPINAVDRSASRAPPCVPRVASSKGHCDPPCRPPTRPGSHSFDRTSAPCAPEQAGREVVERYCGRFPMRTPPNWWKTIHRLASWPPRIDAPA